MTGRTTEAQRGKRNTGFLIRETDSEQDISELWDKRNSCVTGRAGRGQLRIGWAETASGGRWWGARANPRELWARGPEWDGAWCE